MSFKAFRATLSQATLVAFVVTGTPVVTLSDSGAVAVAEIVQAVLK